MSPGWNGDWKTVHERGEAGAKSDYDAAQGQGTGIRLCVYPAIVRVSRGDDRELLLWDEHSGPTGERSFLLAADDHSEQGAPRCTTTSTNCARIKACWKAPACWRLRYPRRASPGAERQPHRGRGQW